MPLNPASPAMAQADLFDADLARFSDAELLQAVDQLLAMFHRIVSRVCAVRDEQHRRLGEDELPFEGDPHV